MISNTNVFIPVCLYPHTRYRTKAGISDLFNKFVLRRNKHLIVIADYLSGLDNILTGRFWSIDTAFIKARQEGRQIFKGTSKNADFRRIMRI
jgi:hypothetical protein